MVVPTVIVPYGAAAQNLKLYKNIKVNINSRWLIFNLTHRPMYLHCAKALSKNLTVWADRRVRRKIPENCMRMYVVLWRPIPERKFFQKMSFHTSLYSVLKDEQNGAFVSCLGPFLPEKNESIMYNVHGYGNDYELYNIHGWNQIEFILHMFVIV